MPTYKPGSAPVYPLGKANNGPAGGGSRPGQKGEMGGKAGFRGGLPKQGGKPDFSGQRKKGNPQRNALSSALKMLAETMLSQRQGQKLTPDNDEVDSPEDRDSPEARKADGMGGASSGAPFGSGGSNSGGQARKAKSKSLYGMAKSSAKPASGSKPEGVKKGSRFG